MCHCPYVLEEMDSDSESEEYETISYTMVCKELEEIINGEKFPIECKVAIQNKDNKSTQQKLELHSSVIEVLSKVSPSERKEAQQTDPTISQLGAVGKGTRGYYQQFMGPKCYRCSMKSRATRE